MVRGVDCLLKQRLVATVIRKYFQHLLLAIIISHHYYYQILLPNIISNIVVFDIIKTKIIENTYFFYSYLSPRNSEIRFNKNLATSFCDDMKLFEKLFEPKIMGFDFIVDVCFLLVFMRP